jgi:hypothetical protein
MGLDGYCQCPRGYTGQLCQTKSTQPSVQPDSSNYGGGGGSNNAPCLNGGYLIQNSLCKCPTGYSGRRCEIFTDTGKNSKILGFSLGSILPILFLVVVIGLFYYCCCYKSKIQIILKLIELKFNVFCFRKR